MYYQVWKNKDNDGDMFITIPENVSKMLKINRVSGEEFFHSHTIIADTWNEAMTIHHVNNNWEPYVPIATI